MGHMMFEFVHHNLIGSDDIKLNMNVITMCDETFNPKLHICSHYFSHHIPISVT